MQQEKETISQESHVFTRRQLASMTLPFILDSLSIMLISMLITALISSAGESSVAAVNLVSPIFTLIVCLMNGISAGGTVEIAQSYGSRDMERMNLAAGHILWMTFLSGTALSLVLILFPRPILTALYPQAEPEVLEKAVTYMVQGSFSLILFTIYTGIFCILRGLGASGKCLCLTIVINVAYLLFSILFLNVWKLDILGSALAQIAARALGSGCALVFLLHPGKLPIHITRKNLFVCRRDVAASILRVSVPFGLEQIFLYGGNIVIATMTVPLGTFAISANAIASSLQGVITAAGLAAGNLAVTIVGQSIGRGAFRDARRYGYGSIALGLGLLCLGAGICYRCCPLCCKASTLPLPPCGRRCWGCCTICLFPCCCSGLSPTSPPMCCGPVTTLSSPRCCPCCPCGACALALAMCCASRWGWALKACGSPCGPSGPCERRH